MKAHADFAGLVGITGLTANATNIDVSVNRGGGKNADGTDNKTVVNFSALENNTGLTVPGTSLKLAFAGPLLEASATIELKILDYVFVSGSFAVRSGPEETIKLTGGASKKVQALTIGGDNITVFAGLNGPDANPDAVGLRATGIKFGVVLFKSTELNDTSSYFAVNAHIGSLQLLGLPPSITLSDVSLDVQVNGGNDTTVTNRVVDFATTYETSPGLKDGVLQVKTGGSTVGIGFALNLIKVRGTANLTLTAGVASLTLGTGTNGFFEFERKLISVNGVDEQVIRLSFENISTSLTAGSGSAGIKIAASDIDGAFLITGAGVAGKVTVGSVALTDAAGQLPIWLTAFSFSNLKLELNTTGAGVSATIGSTSFDYTDPLRHNFIAVSGEFSIGLSFGGLALTLNTTPTTGRVSFEKSSITVNNTAVDVFKVGLLHVNTSLTVGAGANGVKIAIDDISGAFLMKGAGVAGKLTIGSLTLTDADGNTRPDISLVASDFQLEINTTGAAASATIDGVGFDYSTSDKFTYLSAVGTADLTITAGPVSAKVSGTFGFEKTTVTIGGTPTSVIKVFAKDASTSLTIGDEPGGVRVAFDQINGALLIKDSGVAGKLTIGHIGITKADGVTPLPGLVFSVTGFTLAFNTTNTDIVTTIGGVALNFTGTAKRNFLALSGTLDLSLDNFITISGGFGFIRNGDEIRVAAESVQATMGVGTFSVGLTGGKLALLLKADGTKALDASGGLTLNGGGFASVSATSVRLQYNNTGTNYSAPGAALPIVVNDIDGGSLSMGLGTPAAPLIKLSVTGLNATIAGAFTISGNFDFEKSTTSAGTSIIKAAVTNFHVAIGDGTKDYVDLQQAAGQTGALLVTPEGIAAKLTINLTVKNITVLAISGTFTVAINTIPRAVKETFSVAGQTVVLDLPQGNYIHAEANPIDITLLDTTLTGKVAFTQSTKADGSKIVVIEASGISIKTLGANGTGKLPDGIANALKDASGILVIKNGQVAGALSFTLDQPLGGFSGSVKLIINTGTEGVTVSGTFGSINVGGGPLFAIEANLTLVFPGVEISGVFGFQSVTDTATGQQVQVITGNSVRIFIGSHIGTELLGVELTNGQAIFLKDAAGKLAGFVSGHVAIVGVDGVTMEATMSVRLNNQGVTVNKTYVVDGVTKKLVFGIGEEGIGDNPFVQVAGVGINLRIADTVDLSGNVTLTRAKLAVSGGTQDVFLVGSNDFQVYLGRGPPTLSNGQPNPDAVGLLISNIRFGLVLYTGGAQSGKFAFDGQGTVGFVGLPGMEFQGGVVFGLRLNRTGAPVNSISVPVVTAVNADGTNTYQQVVVNFADASDTPEFQAGVDIQFDSDGKPVFQLSGLLGVRQLPGGVADITVKGLASPESGTACPTGTSGASIKIYAGDTTPAFAFCGIANFRIGGTEGFRLQDFRINSVAIFGQNVLTAPQDARNRPLTADLVSPINGGVLSRASLTFIDVVFNDVNGFGIDESSINGDEFRLLLNGNPVSGITFAAPVKRFGTTYRYAIIGTLASDGDYTVEFRAPDAASPEAGWKDRRTGTPNRSAKEAETFTLVTPPAGSGPGAVLTAGPIAQLVNPAGGVVLDPKALSARGYIDISFTSRSGDPIDPDSLNGDEFLLSGTGTTADTRVMTTAPLHLFKNTYRYLIFDADPANTTAAFQDGVVTVTFAAGKFFAGVGGAAVGNTFQTLSFTLNAAQAATAQSTTSIAIGPLTLVNPSVSIQDFGFADGKLALTVALSLDSASLNFAPTGNTVTPGAKQTDSGITASLTGLLVTFGLAVGLPGNFSVSTTGKFSVLAAQLKVVVKDTFELTAAGIQIQYDPADTSPDQELVRIDKAKIKFLGTLSSFGEIEISSINDPDHAGQKIPGLVVRKNGFTLGQALFTKPGPFDFGSILHLDDIRIGVTNFDVNFDDPLSTFTKFSGSIVFATGGAVLLPGKPTSAIISDRLTADDKNPDGTPNTEAMRAELTFDEGKVASLIFRVDTLKLTIADVLTLTAQDFNLNTGATGSDFLVQFGQLGATVKIGSLEIGGEARNFGITADGDFKVLPGKQFSVVLNIGGASGSALGWPSWLPIQITTLGLSWIDFEHHPADFDILLSATVTGLKGTSGLQFSGTIEGIKIRPSLLLQGKFPIVEIASLGVTLQGNLFGGELNAGLIGGILKIVDTDPGPATSPGIAADGTTPAESDILDRVFFLGVEGGFSMAGLGGLTIRFALSELGPLGVFLSVDVPGGIIIVPPIGLAMNDFTASVEFFKTLPSIDDPQRLRDPAFSVTNTVTAADWLAGVKDQVFKQYMALRANPNLSGFAAAFTSPMVIKGSAKIFLAATSQEAFNGQVDVIISTDGKFLITGKLNFAANLLSVSGKLYADLSHIADGNVTVLFLADVPDQVRLLTIDGKLKLGFRDATGAEVAILVAPDMPANTNTAATGALSFPGNGQTVDAGSINLHPNTSGGTGFYVDVRFTPGANRQLDYLSILDTPGEISGTLTKADGTIVPITFNGTPLPIETSVVDGVATETVLTAADTAALAALLKSKGVQRFRYLITNPSFAWAPGLVTVTFTGSTWSQTNPDGTGSVGNTATSGSFLLLGPTVALANPAADGHVKVNELNGRLSLDITFTPTVGATMSLTAANAPAIRLSGPGVGTAAPTGTPSLLPRIGTQFGSVASTTGLVTSLDAATSSLPSEIATLFGGARALGASITVATWTAGSVWTVTDTASSKRYWIQKQAGTITVHDETASETFRYSLTGAFAIGAVTVELAQNSFADSSGAGNVAGSFATYGTQFATTPATAALTGALDGGTVPTIVGTLFTGANALSAAAALSTDTTGQRWRLVDGAKLFYIVLDANGALSVRRVSEQSTFVVDGATADLASPANGGVVGITNLGTAGYVDVVFTPASGASIAPGTLIDGSAELEITLSDGSSLMVAVDPTQPGALAGTNVYRYTFTGTLVAGVALVRFLDGSFTDTDAIANVGEVETFTIQIPTGTLTNVSSSGAILASDLNDLVKGKAAGLFDSSATDRYFEIELHPTTGKTATGDPIGPDDTTISASDLTIVGASGITITAVSRVAGTNRFRFTYTGTFTVPSETTPLSVTLHMAAGAWKDEAGNDSAAFDQTFLVRKPAAAFFIELAGGVTLNSPAQIPGAPTGEPIFDIRGHVLFQATTTAAGNRFQLDFDGSFKVIYLGNLGSVAGRFVYDATKPTSGPDLDAVTVGDLLSDLGIPISGIPQLTGIEMPKIWGVIKLETNLEALKNIGIDLKLAGVLEVNTTKTDKTETMQLKGIPGNEFAHLTSTAALISSLNAGTLPTELAALFTGAERAQHRRARRRHDHRRPALADHRPRRRRPAVLRPPQGRGDAD